MAGDWIKMRSNLWDDPRVARIVDATDSSEATVVGALYWLWATADQHTEDGVLIGMSLRALDRKTGVQGFGAALVSVGWLADGEEGVRVVRFEEHNGRSAKRRCSESVRKMSARDADKEQTASGQAADEKQTACAPREREERRDKPEASASGSASAPKAKRATVLPADFEPNETAHSLAASLGLSVADELPKFRDYHTHKGTVGKDWQAGFRTWLSKAAEFRGHQPRGSPGLTGRDAARAIASATRLEDFVDDQGTFTRLLG